MPAQEERFITYVGCAFAMKVCVKGQVTQFQKPAKKLVHLANSDAFTIFGINFVWFWKKASVFLFYIGNVPLLIPFEVMP